MAVTAVGGGRRDDSRRFLADDRPSAVAASIPRPGDRDILAFPDQCARILKKHQKLTGTKKTSADVTRRNLFPGRRNDPT